MSDEPPTLAPDIPAEGLKHDWELLDRYQAFSAELLRMSLAGIAAVGFLVAGLAGNDSWLNIPWVPAASKWFIGVTLFALALSAGTALLHRFVSSDSMAYHISLLRMQLRSRSETDIESEKAARNRRFKQSGLLLLMSGLFLGIGAFALVLSFVVLLARIAG